MKIISIDDCNSCPYYRSGGEIHRAWCIKERENFEWKHSGDIPAWCPLDDAPNQAMHSDGEGRCNCPVQGLTVFHKPGCEYYE